MDAEKHNGLLLCVAHIEKHVAIIGIGSFFSIPYKSYASAFEQLYQIH